MVNDYNGKTIRARKCVISTKNPQLETQLPKNLNFINNWKATHSNIMIVMWGMTPSTHEVKRSGPFHLNKCSGLLLYESGMLHSCFQGQLL